MTFFLFMAAAFAHDLDAAFARRAFAARSPAALAEVRRRFERARVAELACRIQRARGLAPLACFRARRLATDWGLGPAPAAERAELERRCALAAERLRVPMTDDADGVSPECLRRVREARKTLIYRTRDDWPDD